MFGLCVRCTCRDQASAEACDRLVAETVAGIKASEPGTLVYASHLVEGQPLQRIHPADRQGHRRLTGRARGRTPG